MFLRVLLWIGAALGIIACQIATLRGSNCFRDFKLYPDFPTQLNDNLGGNLGNLILLPGYGVLLMIVLSYCCRAVFMCWAGRLVKRRYAAGARPKAFVKKVGSLSERSQSEGSEREMIPTRSVPPRPASVAYSASSASAATTGCSNGSGGAPAPPVINVSRAWRSLSGF